MGLSGIGKVGVGRAPLLRTQVKFLVTSTRPPEYIFDNYQLKSGGSSNPQQSHAVAGDKKGLPSS